MAFCSNCGAELDEGVAFCTNCGAKQTGEENATAPKQVNSVYQGQSQASTQANAIPAEKTGFFGAVGSCFRHAFDFKGRASRSEFWWFFLFSLIALYLYEFVMNFISAYGEVPYFFRAILSAFRWTISPVSFFHGLQFNFFARPGFELVLPYFVGINDYFVFWSVDRGFFYLLRNRMEIAIFYIPWLAVSFRRLHDTGHSGWWAFCPIVPLFWYFKDSVSETNTWGANPKIKK